jgi:hypothetical protein
MIKKLFFIAALLAPGLAYGGNPSADLSVQVVPAASAGSCGAIMGQAATDAATAGFNTCALYNDFTTAIPNTVGTGLPGTGAAQNTSAPGNWLNCNWDNSNNYVWNWGQGYTGSATDRPPCSRIYQTSDQGGLVLRWDILPADLVNGDTGLLNPAITTDNNRAPQGPYPGPHVFPTGSYSEITLRADNMSSNYSGISFWSPGGGPVSGGCYTTEYDFIQFDFVGGANQTNPAWDNYSCSTGFINFGGPGGNAMDSSAYHTYGTLVTQDNGNGHFSMCTYLDGSRTSCGGSSFDDSLTYQDHRILIVDNLIACGGAEGNSSCIGGFSNQTVYIKSIKVLTCSDWENSSNLQAAACGGNNFNGAFYTP